MTSAEPDAARATPALRAATRADAESVRTLVFEALREFGFTPDPAGVDADLADLEASYLVRGGAFEVLEDGRNGVIGCYGLYPVNRTTVELRKMYLHPSMRGLGLGRRLLGRALARAEALGFRTLELQTAAVLQRALSLYRRFGFTPFEPRHRVERGDLALRVHLGGHRIA